MRLEEGFARQLLMDCMATWDTIQLQQHALELLHIWTLEWVHHQKLRAHLQQLGQTWLCAPRQITASIDIFVYIQSEGPYQLDKSM